MSSYSQRGRLSMARLLLFAVFLILLSAPKPLRAEAPDAAAKAPEAGAKAADAGPAIDPAVAEELKYADGLNALGLSFYADIVLSKIKEGADGGRKDVLKVKALAQIKKFDQALAIIAKQPDQDGQPVWAMKLSMADIYYGWGMYTNAQAIY